MNFSNLKTALKPASLCVLIGCLITNQSCKPTDSAPRPNVILIMTDDLGWHDVGFNGNTEVKTPNLDALAAKGVIFNRFYSASPVCSPTRASVMTGRHPLRTNIANANHGHLKQEEITIAEILKEKGYRTSHFGKWHLGILTNSIIDANRGGRLENKNHFSIPTMHGYNSFFCTESKVPTFDPMVFPESFDVGESKRFGWKAITDKASKPYGTAYWIENEIKETRNLKGGNSKLIMDRVLPFIDASNVTNTPFFTTIWLHTPHLPVVADSTHREMYSKYELDKQLYYGSITAMDEQIGRLWEKLEAIGHQDNTLIMFCSDNGPERGTPGSASHFRERKRSLYEGGVRVPAFAFWKNNIEGGTKTNFPAVTSDYLPTVLNALNLPAITDRPIDGTNLLPALTRNKTKREKAIGFSYQNKISWVDNQYKLISTNKGETYELYDLLKDPSEKNNILATAPKIVNSMKKELNTWLSSIENSKNGNDYN